MSVFSTGPSGGVIAKALTDVLGIGASIDGQGRFLSRLGPAIRRVLANPNGVVNDFGGSLAMDPQNGRVYVNTGLNNVQSVNWATLATSGSLGGPAVYGQFSSLVDQPLVAGVPYVSLFDTVDAASGTSLTAGGTGLSRVTVASAGVYEFTVSFQILHAGGGGINFIFWPRLNNIDVPHSASSVEMGNNNNRTLPFVNFITPVAAGGFVEWIAYSTGGGTRVEHFPEVIGPPYIPAIPSVICSVKRLGDV